MWSVSSSLLVVGSSLHNVDQLEIVHLAALDRSFLPHLLDLRTQQRRVNTTRLFTAYVQKSKSVMNLPIGYSAREATITTL